MKWILLFLCWLFFAGCVSLQTSEQNLVVAKKERRAAIERLLAAKIPDDCEEWEERKVQLWSKISYWEGYEDACRHFNRGIILQ